MNNNRIIALKIAQGYLASTSLASHNNNRRSSALMAVRASLVLRDPHSSHVSRQLAGSVLSQAAPLDPRASGQRRTSLSMAIIASHILNSPGFSDLEKALAGSVLSQRAQ
ncbi:hypothetical protein A6S26_33880 [Nostoc sp. ATCC 43529]|nr:hypothetical protein A6S26_33880 [Nostoc sp. ATCC 43529]